ncbi:MAG: hypothetical protein JW990_02440 [Thermoleophilia bacterium]|nr:hypothetical protein [Thermoleophilia bacterium]
MIQIGEAAGAVLLEYLTSASVPPEIGYRLAESGDGYKLRLDRPSDEDRVVEQEGHVLFMVDQKLDEALHDVILDVKDGDEDTLALEPARTARTASP